jgi:thiosulfate/3-mercaptopyruvate sulfurtransferase
MDSLVSTDWLSQHLGESDLVLVDSSWHMAASGRNGREEYLTAHIPGARFLDIDELSDRSNPAPHMLPSAKDFGLAMERLGLGREDRIIIYDNSPIRTAARGWFMLRHFGAEHASILDGGFQKWTSEGRPTESGAPEARKARFDAVSRDEIMTKQQLLAGAGIPWVDARGRPRFEGTEADPGLGSRQAMRPAPATCPSRHSTARTVGSSRWKRSSPVRRGRRRSEAAVRRQLRIGVTANSLIFAAHLIGNEKAPIRRKLSECRPVDA